MAFDDYWDFDPKEWGKRPIGAEIRTRFANAAIPGAPFKVTSVPVRLTQWESDKEAYWAGSGPASLIAGKNTELSKVGSQ